MDLWRRTPRLKSGFFFPPANIHLTHTSTEQEHLQDFSEN